MITSTAANKYAVVRSFGPSSIVVCSEKSSIITQSFESYSELVSIQSRNESTSEEISVNELEEHSEYSLQVGVIITIWVIQKYLLRFYKILILILMEVLTFWMKGRRNQFNHNLHLLQSNMSNQISALIFIITEYILIELAHIYMFSQNLRTSIFLCDCWTWILKGVKVEWNSKVHVVFKSVFVI